MIIPIALRVGFMSFPPLENAGTRQMPHRNIDDGPEDQVVGLGLTSRDHLALKGMPTRVLIKSG